MTSGISAARCAHRAACLTPQQPSPADTQELELVRRQKREAVEKEDYDLASELRQKELQLERQGQSEAALVASAGLRLLAGSSPEALLRSFAPKVAESAAKAGPELWEDVTADLRDVSGKVTAALGT